MRALTFYTDESKTKLGILSPETKHQLPDWCDVKERDYFKGDDGCFYEEGYEPEYDLEAIRSMAMNEAYAKLQEVKDAYIQQRMDEELATMQGAEAQPALLSLDVDEATEPTPLERYAEAKLLLQRLCAAESVQELKAAQQDASGV